MKKKILTVICAILLILPGLIIFSACKKNEKTLSSMAVKIVNDELLARYDQANNAIKYTYGETISISKEDFEVTATYVDNSTAIITDYTFELEETLKSAVVPYNQNGYEIMFKNNNVVKYRVFVRVARAQVAKPTIADVECAYTGSQLTAQLSGFDSSCMEAHNNKRVEAGTQNVTVTIDNNHEWTDGTRNPVVLEWTVNKAKLNKPTAYQEIDYAYTGEAQHPVASDFTGFNSNLMEIVSDSKTLVGNYSAVVVLKESAKANYTWADGSQGQALIPWSISKAELAKPTLALSEFTYKGSLYTLEFAGVDSSLMTVTNDAQTNAGSYQAVIALKPLAKENYTWVGGDSEDLTFSWTINKKALDFTPTLDTSVQKYYTGQSQTIAVEDYEGVVESGALTGTTVGSYTVTFTPDANHTWADGTVAPVNCDWTIAKASVQKPTLDDYSSDYVVGGQTYLPQGYNVATMNIEGNNQTNAGSYTVTISLKDAQNYEWVDATTADLTISWTINKVKVEKLAENTAVFTYNGADQTYFVDGAYDDALVEIEGNAQKNAGTYTVTVSLKDTVNYAWTDGNTADLTFTWVINKISLAKPTLVDKEYVYSGEMQTAEVNGYDSETMQISNNTETDAITKNIYISLKDSTNYQWDDESIAPVTLSWTIDPQEVAFPTLVEKEYVYTGEALTLEFTDELPSYMTITGNTYTEAGSYVVKITLDANYCWTSETNSNFTINSDNELEAIYTWTIKASA